MEDKRNYQKYDGKIWRLPSFFIRKIQEDLDYLIHEMKDEIRQPHWNRELLVRHMKRSLNDVKNILRGRNVILELKYSWVVKTRSNSVGNWFLDVRRNWRSSPNTKRKSTSGGDRCGGQDWRHNSCTTTSHKKKQWRSRSNSSQCDRRKRAPAEVP